MIAHNGRAAGSTPMIGGVAPAPPQGRGYSLSSRPIAAGILAAIVSPPFAHK